MGSNLAADNYDRTIRVVSALLYAFDPAGMGATVSAPTDEYDSAAAKLIAGAHGGTDLTSLVTNSFPDATEQLAMGVVAALEMHLTTLRR